MFSALDFGQVLPIGFSDDGYEQSGSITAGRLLSSTRKPLKLSGFHIYLLNEASSMQELGLL